MVVDFSRSPLCVPMADRFFSAEVHVRFPAVSRLLFPLVEKKKKKNQRIENADEK